VLLIKQINKSFSYVSTICICKMIEHSLPSSFTFKSVEMNNDFIFLKAVKVTF